MFHGAFLLLRGLRQGHRPVPVQRSLGRSAGFVTLRHIVERRLEVGWRAGPPGSLKAVIDPVCMTLMYKFCDMPRPCRIRRVVNGLELTGRRRLTPDGDCLTSPARAPAAPIGVFS